ncbi:amidohydrolase family protein [Occultella aeris]|uniref:Amidohydrolase-related domain-containing protein n=1 Tax=Occultella aeris TaxID=2761496 RepID=A0A7M4DHA4_9MICO|nr:amidohydrolase family protein [Occultella aeris]VZO36297.1 hypothetical protein HALOF300_01501 [Occultella aeris]
MTAATNETLFRNVRVFDGTSAQVSDPSDVLVRDGVIEVVSRSPVAAAADGAPRVELDGGGRVLMPGLIDAHWHSMFATLPLQALMTADVGYVNILAAREAEATLQRGFTTVREAGGPVFGLKRAVDAGLVPGPRIYPAGAMISQTSGHGDFRFPFELPRGVCGHLAHIERIGACVIADGVPEVLRGVREQLRLGATQIKVMAGGGVSSSYDPIDVTQYTEAELRSAVDAASDWGTYVMVHAYTPAAVQRALRAGVRSIEHGHLLDSETVAMIAEHDAWWCPQPFLDDEDKVTVPPTSEWKLERILEGTERAYGLARQHGINLAWGSDTLFDARLATRQGAQLTKLTRWFGAAEVLTLATSANAQLCALSGERNPYPGVLGEVRSGAIADLLLVDGDPVADIDLLADPVANLVAIMKGGVLHKNTLT